MVRAVMVCGMLAGLAMVGRIVSRGMVKAGFFMSDLLLIIGLLSAWVVDGLGVWGKYQKSLYEDSRQVTDSFGQRPNWA